MPNKRNRGHRKVVTEVDLPVDSNFSDDTPKAFARLFRYKELAEKRAQQKKQESKDKTNKQNLQIQPGERYKEFSQRVNQEFQKNVINAIKSTKPITERKKRNREARKLKLQEKKKKTAELRNARDFDDLKDRVQFGEVANEPPTFSKIPKARGQGKQTLEAKPQEESVKQGYESEEDENMKQLKASHKRKLQNMSASARKTLDAEREKAIEIYRTKKAKRMAESGLTPATWPALS